MNTSNLLKSGLINTLLDKSLILFLTYIGTTFQKGVWQTLLQIPYGQTFTYKQVAQSVAKDPHHLPIRAVGGAIGRNHISLMVPCHRVIGSNGNLTGYSAGIDKKVELLKLENIL